MGRVQLLEHAQDGVGEAVDGGHHLAGLADGQRLLEGVIGAVDDAVPVEEDQQGLLIGRSHRGDYSTGGSGCEGTNQRYYVYCPTGLAGRFPGVRVPSHHFADAFKGLLDV